MGDVPDPVSAPASSPGHRSRSVHDRVINRIFSSGLTLAGILSLERVDCDVSDRLRDVIDQLDLAVAELRTAALANIVAEPEAGREGQGYHPVRP